MNTDRFKFRVWSKYERKYLNDRPDIAINRQGKLMFDSIDGQEEFDPTREDYIVEQCTGLKDRGGRLIYEGDIVERNIHEYFLVVFNAERGAFMRMRYTRVSEKLIDNEYLPFSNNVAGRTFAVGNIHENHKLLRV